MKAILPQFVHRRTRGDLTRNSDSPKIMLKIYIKINRPVVKFKTVFYRMRFLNYCWEINKKNELSKVQYVFDFNHFNTRNFRSTPSTRKSDNIQKKLVKNPTSHCIHTTGSGSLHSTSKKTFIFLNRNMNYDSARIKSHYISCRFKLHTAELKKKNH